MAVMREWGENPEGRRLLASLCREASDFSPSPIPTRSLLWKCAAAALTCSNPMRLPSVSFLFALSALLTPAEREVAQSVALGLSNSEIAKKRGTSVPTVVNQLGAIFKKLGVSGRVGLCSLFARQGPNGGLFS